jgi:hypothetical protein
VRGSVADLSRTQLRRATPGASREHGLRSSGGGGVPSGSFQAWRGGAGSSGTGSAGARGAGFLYEPDAERLAAQRRGEPRGVSAGTTTGVGGGAGVAGAGGGPSWPQRRRNAGTVTEEPLLEYASLLEQHQAQREEAGAAEAAAFDVLDPLGRFRPAETQLRTSVFQGAGPFASSGGAAARPPPLHFPEGVALNAFRQPPERMAATGARDFGGGYAAVSFEAGGAAPGGFGSGVEELPTRAASEAFATYGQRQQALGALRAPAGFDLAALERQGRLSALWGVGDGLLDGIGGMAGGGGIGSDASTQAAASAMFRRAASAAAALGGAGAPFGRSDGLVGPPSPRRVRGVALPLRATMLSDDIALRSQ